MVIRTHAVPVRAGHRSGKDVTDGDVVGNPGLAYQDVARLAVLADDPHGARARCVRGARQERLVATAVEHWSWIVAHPAIHREIRADARKIFDRADGVESDRR